MANTAICVDDVQVVKRFNLLVVHFACAPHALGPIRSTPPCALCEKNGSPRYFSDIVDALAESFGVDLDSVLDTVLGSDLDSDFDSGLGSDFETFSLDPPEESFFSEVEEVAFSGAPVLVL